MYVNREFIVGQFLSSVPMFLLGLVGGVLADRVHRQRLLSLTQGTNVTSSFMLTLLLSTGAVQVWHVYLAILITGSCWALDTPSRRAVIYDLLGVEGVTNAVALDSVGMNLTFPFLVFSLYGRRFPRVAL